MERQDEKAGILGNRGFFIFIRYLPFLPHLRKIFPIPANFLSN
jgi:hypothetical protein